MKFALSLVGRLVVRSVLRCQRCLHSRRCLAGLDALSSRFLAREAAGGLDEVVVQAGLATVLTTILATTVLAVLLSILLSSLLTSSLASALLPSYDVDLARYVYGGSLDEAC